MASTKRKEAVKAPSEKDWNLHKAALRDLYFENTLKELMQKMEQDHQFIASKNQFERKFKEWGFRKYLHKEELKAVLYKKRKRDDEGKISRVSLNGIFIPEKRIKKDEGRCTISELECIYSASNFPSPEGIIVATPPSAIVEKILKRIPIENLPGFGMFDLLSSLSTSSSLLHIFQQKHPSSSVVSSPAPNPITFDIEEYTVASSVFTQGSPRSHIPELSMPVITENMIQSVFLERYGQSSLTPLKMNSKHTMARGVESYMLERFDREMSCQLEKLFGPSDSDSFLHFVSFAAYFASNGVLEEHQLRRLLEWIVDQQRSFLQSIISMKSSTLQACLEKLTSFAASNRDARAFQILFDADINRQLYRGHREMLMLHAVSLSKVEILRSLLDEGLEPNFIAAKGQTLLGEATCIKIVRLLLSNGVNINTACRACDWLLNTDSTPLVNSILRGDDRIAQVLLDEGAIFMPLVNSQYTSISFLRRALIDEKFELAKLLLRMGVTSNNPTTYPFSVMGNNRFWLSTELQYACFRGYAGLVAEILQTPSGKVTLSSSYYSWSPLRDAAMAGEVDIVTLLIEAGADVNASSNVFEDSVCCLKSEDWEELLYPHRPKFRVLPSTPLLAAIEGGYTQVVEILLHNSVDVNAPAVGEHGTNILEVAEALGHHDIASLLAKEGASLNAPRSVGYQIIELRLAARRNDIQRARALVRSGIYACHILDSLTVTWSFISYSTDTYKVINNCLLIYMDLCGNDLNARGPINNHSALEIAIKSRQHSVIRNLILAGASLDSPVPHFGSVLRLAIHYIGDDDIIPLVNLMLKHGARVDSPRTARTDTALDEALIQGNVELAELLASMGAVFEPFDAAHKFWGIELPKFELLEFLMVLGEHLEERGEFYGRILPLALESPDQNLELIYSLLERGTDVNAAPATRGYGRTALQVAVNTQNIETIKLLLEKGADINAPPSEEEYSRTALQAAVEILNIEITDLLLGKGADINASPAPYRGITALQGAAINGYIKIAYLLLEQGADPNAPGAETDGRTALEGAAEQGRLDMVQLLLNAGAEPSEEARKFAEKEGHFVIADIMEKALEEQESDSCI